MEMDVISLVMQAEAKYNSAEIPLLFAKNGYSD